MGCISETTVSLPEVPDPESNPPALGGEMIIPTYSKKDYCAGCRKDRRKIRRSNRYAKIGKAIQAAEPLVYVCCTCGSGWDADTPCPCFTEGIQCRMEFDPRPSFNVMSQVAQFSDYFAGPGQWGGWYDAPLNSLKAAIDDAVKQIEQDMDANFAASIAAMADAMAEMTHTAAVTLPEGGASVPAIQVGPFPRALAQAIPAFAQSVPAKDSKGFGSD
jgi:hypothetical protein